jgi:hypothetical protein
MYLALGYDPVDAQLSGAFMRLWQPESSFLKDGLFSHVSVRIMYLDTPGAIQMMVDFADRGYEAEAAPSGHWTLPYGALSIHRREDWMVSMKGWSKYVWDFESSDGGENQLGRYLSYGSMLIYARGEPVGRVASGIVQEGWDWSMWPGTTVIRLSHAELNQKINHRNFTDETFVGGVNLNGQNGIFALKLHDTVHNTTFRAIKTVFCFDNLLICLGSGIRNNDTEHPTVTPLFQTALAEDRLTVVNGEEVRAIPYTFRRTADKSMWLMDAVGNGYVIPNGENLRVQRQIQALGDFGKEGGGEGPFELAWLDHGTEPDGAAYHYALLVQTPPGRVRAFAPASEYEVWQQDEQAHIVRHRSLKATGYALFDVAARPTQGAIMAADLPSLVMTREVDNDGLWLSVADPDFGHAWDIQSPHHNSTVIANQPSESRTLRVTVRGKWRLDQSYDLAEIVDEGEDQTVVAFMCQDGKTVEVKLIRPGISVPNLDFDGDGAVGFTDFLFFASKFGLSEDDAGFEAKYDLDGDGLVGFSDFLIFVQGYSKTVGGKPVALRNEGERLGS